MYVKLSKEGTNRYIIDNIIYANTKGPIGIDVRIEKS